MGLVTDKITYNVRDRGRKHLGQDRNLDTSALARLINGPAVQERVRKGDMLGYYGHWPRIKFGMDPAEGGVVDGISVAVPPALRMVEVQADNEGNITHRIEFLDNDEGQIAEKLYRSKVGGFSTAIDVKPGTLPMVPIGFYGADFVTAFGGPNYDGNRGYRGIMDAASGTQNVETLALLDAAVGESFEAARQLNAMLDALTAQHQLALEALDRATQENDLLIGRLASGQAAAVLDDVLGGSARSVQGRVTPDFGKFSDRPLVPLKAIDADKTGRTDDTVMRRLGID